MNIHAIHDLSNRSVVTLLQHSLAQVTDEKLVKNYHPDYIDTPGNLFYILQAGRYQEGKGKYYILERCGEYLGSAGWNEYELDTDIALVLTRMYIPVHNRLNYDIAKYILPLVIDETSKYKKVWATVNEHNKVIYQWFVRSAENKRPALFNNWPPIYKKFYPIGKKDIYYTQQHVMEYTKE
jgi:hypothetical protein